MLNGKAFQNFFPLSLQHISLNCKDEGALRLTNECNDLIHQRATLSEPVQHPM